jgi:hypothetical protein
MIGSDCFFFDFERPPGQFSDISRSVGAAAINGPGMNRDGVCVRSGIRSRHFKDT